MHQPRARDRLNVIVALDIIISIIFSINNFIFTFAKLVLTNQPISELNTTLR